MRLWYLLNFFLRLCMRANVRTSVASCVSVLVTFVEE